MLILSGIFTVQKGDPVVWPIAAVVAGMGLRADPDGTAVVPAFPAPGSDRRGTAGSRETAPGSRLALPSAPREAKFPILLTDLIAKYRDRARQPADPRRFGLIYSGPCASPPRPITPSGQLPNSPRLRTGRSR